MRDLVIDERFRVNIYLDTNILVDYVEKEYPLLTRSIDYLAKCPCVNLRSSHYVLFEFTEVRKGRLFTEIIRKKDTSYAGKDIQKGDLKNHSWKFSHVDYNDFKSEIKAQIQSELNLFCEELHLNFDEHVLHEKLVYPTNSLCLTSKISKEDCLVMISCMFPLDSEPPLSQCVLLSRDHQYHKAYNENKEDVKQVFEESGLTVPEMIRTVNLRLSSLGSCYNLYRDSSEGEIPKIDLFWRDFIKQRLKKNLGPLYIGETYKYGNKDNKCIFFELDDPCKSLEQSDGLCFISQDLKKRYSVDGPFEFWNVEKVSLPFSNPDFPKFSFQTTDMDPEKLAALRQKGLIVFYDRV